ncbi:MAG: hypothetical protein ACFFFT_06745 [Candidatus Thorarchaeota archaeon]
MIKIKKLITILLLVLCALSFIGPFIPIATCTTTQGDTTFSVDEGDIYNWTATGGLPPVIGCKFELTIEDIYNGSHMTVNSFIIDATLRFWNNTAKMWINELNNTFFVAANKTQNFIDYEDSRIENSPLFFIIPTPINMTMIAEYANSTGYYLDYSIDGNKLTLESILGYILYTTFNSDGFLTKVVSEYAGITLSVFVLGEGGGENAIPFGYSFLIFSVIGTISLIYLEKRKIE